MAWNPTGSRLASCAGDGTCIIWNTSTWEQALVLGGPGENPGFWGAWSPDGNRLAATSINGLVKIWDATSGQLISTLSGGDEEPFGEIAWSPDGTQIAGVTDHTVKTWDVATGQLTSIYETTEYLNTLAWDPDGSRVLYGGDSMSVPAEVTVPSTRTSTPSAKPTDSHPE